MGEIWNTVTKKGRYRNASLILTAVLMVTMVLFGCTGSQIASAADSGMDFTFSNRDQDPSYDTAEAAKIELSDGGITVTGTGAENVSTAKDASGKNVITISDEGTYILSGTLTDGRIVVNAEDTDKLQLVLNGVNIHCSDNAALYIAKADKVFVTLAEGTQNSLSDGESYELSEDESSIDGTVYSKADLTINGSGSLTVTGSYKHGIVSKDDLVITGGTLSVTANGQGLHGKDCVKIKDASITLNTQGDGIQSDNADNEAKGFVYISSGTLNITSEGDAVQAETTLRVDGGSITVKTGGGSAQTAEKQTSGENGGMPGGEGGRPDGGRGGFGGFGNGGENVSGSAMQPPQMSQSGQPAQSMKENSESLKAAGIGMNPQQLFGTESTAGTAGTASEETKTAGKADKPAAGTAAIQPAAQTANTADGAADTAEDDSVSTKGLKAGKELLIKGGTITIDSLDDGLHSNGSMTVDGGTISIATGDDGLHADGDVVINSGTITVSKSYEGIEGKTITVNGGTIDVTSSDDGFNASDGSGSSFPGMGGGRPGQGMETQTATGQAVSGQPAAGQSSGTSKSDLYISITGGTVTVNASGDGLDSNGDLRISGGTVTVSGPSGNGDGAIDYDGTGTITGGILMASGSSGMAQGFSGDTSSQCSILYCLTESAAAGTKITLTDSTGTEIVSWTAAKQFDCVQISSPKLEQGKTYTLKVGDTSTEITQDSISVSNGRTSGGMNGGMNGGGRGMNGRPDNGQSTVEQQSQQGGQSAGQQSGTRPNGQRQTPPAAPGSNGAVTTSPL